MFQLCVRPEQGEPGLEEGRLEGEDQACHDPVLDEGLEGGAERDLRAGSPTKN